MNILINLIGVLALLANGMFALHIWSGVSQQDHRRSRGRTVQI